jgi:hypothetical protein
MATIEELRVTATSEIEDEKPLYKQVNNERMEFDSDDYDQAIEDRAQAKLYEQDHGYKDDRQAEYPSIVDQLDDIYHNGIDGWKETIKATKDKYPKPE